MTQRIAYVAAALALLFAIGYASGMARAADDSPIPACQEDAVLLGVGQFNHGHWDAYTCGPARDDYNEEH
jgi:hypothetical protein